MKIPYKQFTAEEFEKHSIYGIKPVLEGWDYFDCKSNCGYPKDLS